MSDADLRQILARVAAGELDVEAAVQRMAWAPIETLGADAFARLDHHRALRQGYPEVVYCPGKAVEQIVEICRHLARRRGGFLATRADPATRQALAAEFENARVHERSGIVFLPGDAQPPVPGQLLVLSAGTADQPVAEEAAITAEALGLQVTQRFDVGVAGIHRLFAEAGALQGADVVIVVAGMEGALASVVGGLVAVPVIAVPTSVGYGASFGGIAALLAMLNSCASGVSVVNIDNGFGAACAAARILRGREPARLQEPGSHAVSAV